MTDIQNTIKTYGAVSVLAKVYRHNHTTFDAARRENVAEHSYSLTVFACALAAELNKVQTEPLDIGRVAQFAAIHDLPEAYMEEGDISVYASKQLLDTKKKLEEEALKELEVVTLGYPWIVDTLKQYEQQNVPEAHFVYALDKILVHMNVLLSGQHHAKPTFEKYEETEEIAKVKITGAYPELLPIFNDLCRMFRENPHFFEDGNDIL